MATVAFGTARSQVGRPRRALPGVVTLLLACGAATAATAKYRIVIEVGDPAPGMPPGSTILGFGGSAGAPVINDHGHVAFVAFVQLPDTSYASVLYAQDGSGIHPVALYGDTLPGAAAPTTDIDQFMINNAGDVCFRATLGDGKQGVWTNGGGTGLRKVMVTGDAAPGAHPNWPGEWAGIASFPAFMFNDPGEVVVAAVVNAGGGGADGLWFNDPSGTSEIAIQYLQAPDRPAGDTLDITGFGARGAGLNDAGEVCFVATYRVFNTNIVLSALWMGVPASPQIVYLQSDPAPGTGGETFSSFVTGAVLNNAGEVEFAAGLDLDPYDPDVCCGEWAGPIGAVELKMRLGDDPAPGFAPGHELVGYGGSNTVMNREGRIAFLGGVAGPIVPPNSDYSQNCIWRESESGLEVVALRDTEAPGTGGRTYMHAGHPSLNAAGQVAFFAAISPFGADAVYLTDPHGAPHVLIVEGDTIELAPGDVRLVTDYVGYIGSIFNTGLEEGRPAGFNEAGEVAFTANLDTGASIIVARVRPDCVGDVNWSGATNVGDFNILAANYGETTTRFNESDVNGDGLVNVADFNLVAGNYGCGG